METKINWFGFVGGLALIVLIIISMFVPWWQLSVGDNLVMVNMSPMNTNFNFVGNSFTIPLIMALNISSIISLSVSSIVILIYSVKPRETYSKRLLGFSYKKPLYSLLLFIICIFVIILLVKSVFNFDVPLTGSTNIMLPSNMTSGIIISVLISANFLWPFWLAATATGFCIAAKVYHKKICQI